MKLKLKEPTPIGSSLGTFPYGSILKDTTQFPIADGEAVMRIWTERGCSVVQITGDKPGRVWTFIVPERFFIPVEVEVISE